MAIALVNDPRINDDNPMAGDQKPRITRWMWITVIIVAFAAWMVTRPIVIRSHRNSGQTDAIQNARQIGIALFEFETEYGRLPDETTAKILRQKYGNRWNLGNTSSNDYFRQLIAAGVVTSQTMFYAKSKFTEKPDPRIALSDQSLAPGEVGYGYLMDGNSALSTAGNPARPLVCTPLTFDGKAVSRQTFEPSIHDGRAVILRFDNSVQSIPIDQKSGAGHVGGGKTLLETGPDTIWGDDAKPVIIPPLPKR